MNTIKMIHLEVQLKRLNEAKGFKDAKYDTVGSYQLQGAYSGWQLQKIVSKGGGVTGITSGYCTKREMYNQLNAILNTI